MMESLFESDGAPVVNTGADMEALRRVLSPEQITLLMRVLVDDQTQHEIARAEDRPQSTIASRVVAARARLKRVGIDVPFPGRGRRRRRERVVYLDPSSMTRLQVTQDEQGFLYGEWIDTREVRDRSVDIDRN